MLATLTISSCVKDVDPTSFEKTKDAILTDNFNTAFGVNEAQYANHRWGMNTVPLVTTESSASRTMRAHNVNGNLWYQNWVRPTNVTEEEIEWAKEEFGKERKDAHPWKSVDWPNYWVQQVYKGGQTYTAGDGKPAGGEGTSGVGSDCMNHIQVFNNKKTEVISWWPYQTNLVTYEGAYEHVNNFNKGNNTTEYIDDVTKEKFIGTTLMVDMGTDGRAEQFSYHNTVDSKDHYEYIVIEHNGSYFVGFDFYAVHPDGQEANKNMDVERDWKFNDWIIKITPAKSIYKFPSDPVRVMAEDLGTSSSDFDYNDVVFDVLFVNDNGDYKANITLQAAGGTLPLYFKYGSNDAFEVHKKFEVATDVMVNTHAADRGLKGVDNKQPVSNIWLDIEDKSYESAEDAVDALKIVVISGGNTIYLTPKASYENYSNAPKMIVAPGGTEWVDERVLISKVYSKFVDWISDPEVKWWVK